MSTKSFSKMVSMIFLINLTFFPLFAGNNSDEIQVADGWGITVTCLAEFWSVVTHPSCSGGPSTPTEAGKFLDNLLRSGGGQIWLPAAHFGEQLTKQAQYLGIQGSRIFDLQIALIALSNGATEIWTHDLHFLRIAGLKVHDPL